MAAFLDDTFQLIAETTIQGVFFGINFSLYFLCTQLFYRQYCKAPHYERRKILFSFLYNSLLVFAAALELGADGRFMQLSFIDHGGIHGEPHVFQNKFQATFSPLRLLTILPGLIMSILNPLMQVS
jgi:hypothetical protein